MVAARGIRAPFFVLVVASAELIILIANFDAWAGEWAATANQIAQGLLFACPAAAACGAAFSGLQRASGYRQLSATSVRGSGAVWRRVVSESALLAAFGFLVAMLIASAATAVISKSIHWVVIATTVPSLGLITLAAAVGALAGIRLPTIAAVLLAAVGMYLIIGTCIFAAWSITATLTPIDTRVMTFYEVDWFLRVGQAAVWSILAFLSISWPCLDQKRRFGLAWVAGLVAAPLLFIGTANRTFDIESAQLICHDTREVRVCLPKAKAFNEEVVASTLSTLSVASAGIVPLRIAFVDDAAAGVSAGIDSQLDRAKVTAVADRYQVLRSSQTYSFTARARVSSDELAVAVLFDYIPPSRSGATSSDGRTLATPSDFLIRDALEHLGVPTDGSGFVGAPVLDDATLDYSLGSQAIKVFRSWSQGERAAWVDSHRDLIQEGQLTWEDFSLS